MSNWGRLSIKEDKQWQSWENDYMPPSGKADTLAGEIIRAMDRIVYRWYNDGDTVDEYGGSEYNHCKGANFFLMEHVPGFETLESKTLGFFSDNEYEDEVCKRLKFVYNYLSNHPEVFETENTEDFLDLSPFEPYNDEDEDEDDGFWNDDEEY